MDQQYTSALKTGDGVRLRYNQTGPSEGQQLLFITGWRQAAVEWRKQVEYFSSAGFRVTTFDWRGHGDSDKPDFGYRISRFAADLNDVLTQLDLKTVTIVGHSMGCSIAWAWWDQYPDVRERIAKFVFVDQSAAMVRDPHWTDEQAAQFSAIFTPGAVYDLAADMAAQLVPLMRSLFAPSVSESDFEWVLSQNKKMSDAHAAALLLDHAFRDWRDVLPRITIPTLVLVGELSILPPSRIPWVATQIPGAQHYTFTAAEKGSHFMFWENPERFNSVVKDFLTH
ncbi:AB hydrolase superfamily protein YdjP [Achaetomium macrosporum]|uniref:AB hydrolase superfamily protein YdjP n=1 Tax=Achaetomium macrosporum TaxID=79813 RepID=A0AAN7HA82_9PEZI|nr:AB hydrolase superfamily protein YdjP [Achaetomium macrosporum]